MPGKLDLNNDMMMTWRRWTWTWTRNDSCGQMCSGGQVEVEGHTHTLLSHLGSPQFSALLPPQNTSNAQDLPKCTIETRIYAFLQTSEYSASSKKIKGMVGTYVVNCPNQPMIKRLRIDIVEHPLFKTFSLKETSFFVAHLGLRFFLSGQCNSWQKLDLHWIKANSDSIGLFDQ